MRSNFDRQLAQLSKELIEMGSLCEEAISIVNKALAEGDVSVREKTLQLDEEIDGMEHTIEGRCLKLMLQQQPVARDLRQISAAIKMITDMERIGDQANDIAEIISFLGGRTGAECAHIGEMGKTVIDMVTKSVDAFIKNDEKAAQEVIDLDDLVDRNFLKVKQELIDMITNNRSDGEYALDLLMISKYYERIGDHASNIAEWVVFSITGFHKGVEEI